MDAVELHGFADEGFGGIADAFAKNFHSAGDVGASTAAYVDGRLVIDLWAGLADSTKDRSWEADTVVGVFSCSKGVIATLVNLLIQEGALDPDEAVARYWPEFAASGKGSVTVRQVLSHQAGLAAIEGDFTLEQALSWDPIVDALAAAAPQWKPGSRHGYHVRSFGWLTGELVRRVTGQTPRAALETRITVPLGLDLWLGMPDSEQHRCARLIPPDATGIGYEKVTPGSLQARALTGPSGLFRYDDMWNSPRIRRAVIPSSGMITNARSLAKLYGSCVSYVNGVRLLAESTVIAAAEPQVQGRDAIIGVETAYGLGYMVGASLSRACGPGTFGHAGAGGSLGFADPNSSMGFAYTMNRMRLDADDTRAGDLCAALYRCVG